MRRHKRNAERGGVKRQRESEIRVVHHVHGAGCDCSMARRKQWPSPAETLPTHAAKMARRSPRRSLDRTMCRRWDRTRVRSRHPWRIISCPAANGIICSSCAPISTCVPERTCLRDCFAHGDEFGLRSAILTCSAPAWRALFHERLTLRARLLFSSIDSDRLARFCRDQFQILAQIAAQRAAR